MLVIPEIYPVAEFGRGKLYVMPKPAAESLDTAAQYFADLGITHVVSHLEKDEERELGLAQEGVLLMEQGIELISYPVKDMHLPEQLDYATFIDSLYKLLQDGCNVAIHCRAGIGRTGMTSSCLLIRNGCTSQNAIDKVKASRGTSIPDTNEQVEFIRSFARSV